MVPSNKLGCAGNNDETLELLRRAGDVRDQRKADAKAAKTRNALRKQRALVAAQADYQQFLQQLQTRPSGAELTPTLFNLPGTFHSVTQPPPPLTQDSHTLGYHPHAHAHTHSLPHTRM